MCCSVEDVFTQLSRLMQIDNTKNVSAQFDFNDGRGCHRCKCSSVTLIDINDHALRCGDVTMVTYQRKIGFMVNDFSSSDKLINWSNNFIMTLRFEALACVVLRRVAFSMLTTSNSVRQNASNITNADIYNYNRLADMLELLQCEHVSEGNTQPEMQLDIRIDDTSNGKRHIYVNADFKKLLAIYELTNYK